MNNQVSRRRLAKALAITMALVFCVPAVEALADAGSVPESEPGSSVAAFEGPRRVGIDAQALIGQGDAYAFLTRLEEASLPNEPVLPQAFMLEVDLPRRYRDLRATEDGTVIGCVVDAPINVVEQDVRSRMSAKGWSEVSLGAVEGSTYIKSGGICTWVLVTYTQVGDATNVVYRCVYR